ncbi:antifungal protein ginkbilobin-like protein [Populus alba x Populus x berolinensis]|nr:antifungal protein ginkbilobin-like protein [Populus alba x Populus x berolinensis]
MGFPPKLALVFIGFFGLCVIATSVPDTNVTTVLCNSGVYSKDCSTCLGAAKTAMFASCQSRIGARSVLHDCTIRYEQYPFSD